MRNSNGSDIPGRRRALRALLAPACAGAAAFAGTLVGVAATEVPGRVRPPDWRTVRTALFGERPIADVEAPTLELVAPVRADDAAVVPITIRAGATGGPVRRLWLVIDGNPSPVAATFTLGDVGRPEIETRVRIDEYTTVRAIAERADGTLQQATRFVKAAGGCSAPPTKDPAAALATLGRLRLRVDDTRRADGTRQAQLLVSHPQHSGLVMDPATRLYTPRRFVSDIGIKYTGRLVLEAQLDFAISENPALRFAFVPASAGNLHVDVADTDGARWSADAAVPFPS